MSVQSIELKRKSICKPDPVLSNKLEAIIHLGQLLPRGSSNLPAQLCVEDKYELRLFGLAPSGVLPATTITSCAVRSYRTFSPLPLLAVYFLRHFP